MLGATLDVVEGQREFANAGCFVDDAGQLAVWSADPAPAVEAGTEISSDTEFADLLVERLLHLQLAAEFDEGGDAVTQQFGRP